MTWCSGCPRTAGLRRSVYADPRTAWGVLWRSLVLVLTPWAPVAYGYGDPIMASIVFLNVVYGPFGWRLLSADG